MHMMKYTVAVLDDTYVATDVQSVGELSCTKKIESCNCSEILNLWIHVTTLCVYVCVSVCVSVCVCVCVCVYVCIIMYHTIQNFGGRNIWRNSS